MASNLLNIVSLEPEQIDEEKLKFICAKHAIWDHFKISKQDYASRSDSEKIQMLKRFYSDLVAVYFGNGKKFFYCNNCVWLGNGKAQDCVRCKVNVVYCDCSSDDELFLDKNWACMVCLASDVSAVDCGISHTIQNASKLSMNKVLEQGKTEMKRNSMDL